MLHTCVSQHPEMHFVSSSDCRYLRAVLQVLFPAFLPVASGCAGMVHVLSSSRVTGSDIATLISSLVIA